MLNFINANEGCLHFDEFYLQKGLTYRTFHTWLAKSEYLENRYNLCKEIIGLRRQKLLAKTNPQTLQHTLYQHSPAWDIADKRNADLKNSDDKQNSSKIVVIERSPDTTIVPNKDE